MELPKDPSKVESTQSMTTKVSPVEPPKDSGNSSRSTKSKRRVIASPEEEEQIEERPVAEPSSSMVRAEEKAAMEAMMGMDMETEVDDLDPENSEKRVEVKKEPKQRKRRPVKKSRTEDDDKGYKGGFDYLGISVEDD